MQTSSGFGRVFLTGLLGLLLASFAYGQHGTGSVTGTVTDPTGAIVPGAGVTLINTATNVQKTTETTGAGNFHFDFVDVGKYNLRIAAKGFADYEYDGLE